MAVDIEDLRAVPLFARISRNELEESRDLWARRRLVRGETLWEQGTYADALAVLVRGRLEAWVHETVVGQIGPGEMIGEVAAFTADKRSARIVAGDDSLLLLLPGHALRQIRRDEETLYDVLLDYALHALARRIRRTNQRIALLATGTTDAPVRQESSVFARLWKALKPGGPVDPCPPATPLLRRQPALQHSPIELLDTLADAFTAVPMEEGQVIFLEGEPASQGFVVASGVVDVLRYVRGQKAELLAQLHAGAPFGMNALVDRSARTASCVAQTAGWLYRIDTDAVDKLPVDVRQFWRESVLASLATQVRNANRILSGFQRTDTDELPSLLRASGYLEALPLDDAELESITFVISDEQRRNHAQSHSRSRSR